MGIQRQISSMTIALGLMSIVQIAQADNRDDFTCSNGMCVAREETQMAIISGIFDDYGANISGYSQSARIEYLEGQRWRSYDFEMGAPIKIFARSEIDPDYRPIDWPADISLGNAGVNLSLHYRRDSGEFTKIDNGFLLPQGADLRIVVGQQMWSSGSYVTFYPARWAITLSYRKVRPDSDWDAPAPVYIPTQTTTLGVVLQDDCGGQAECLPVGDADMVIVPDMTECGADMMECRPPDAIAEIVDDSDLNVDPLTTDAECGVGDMECLPMDTDEAEELPADTQSGLVPADPTLDLAFWNAIKDSDNPVLFSAYLEKFPQGVFAIIAREYLKEQVPPQSGQPVQTVQVPVVTSPASDPVTSQTPRGLFDRAELIMGQVYDQDPALWGAAARRAIPLYQQAGDQGWPPAYVELGALYETAIGVEKNNATALAYYQQAAKMGYPDGAYRSLLLLDQLNDMAGFVAVFLPYYREDPDTALMSLADFSLAAARALQGHLKNAGYYHGALDGNFGPGSRAALLAYVSGAQAPAPSASGDAIAADIQRELARLGCFEGEVDGQWGPYSAQSLAAYNMWADHPTPDNRPTRGTLAVVRAARAPVCGVD